MFSLALDVLVHNSCVMAAGNQATVQYQQTMTFFKPLYKQLKQKVVHPEMVAGLYMIVQAIQQRNYLHAYDVYMRLAIGKSPSPAESSRFI